LGLEIERTLPGGVRARWERDSVGRPLKHEIWSGTVVSAKAYSWEPNDRLKMIVDALNGPVQYRHDGLGNLIGAIYADDKFDLRMPDAVGNLFKTVNKKDRKYGPAGQLLESKGPDGITKYEYDPEGNLAKKILPDGKEWTTNGTAPACWPRSSAPTARPSNSATTLSAAVTWKKYGAKTTKWMWDGNVPVHEWVEVDPAVEDPPRPARSRRLGRGPHRSQTPVSKRTAQGPPPPEAAGTSNAPPSPGSSSPNPSPRSPS
jgi:YD repeat-containing protein